MNKRFLMLSFVMLLSLLIGCKKNEPWESDVEEMLQRVYNVSHEEATALFEGEPENMGEGMWSLPEVEKKLEDRFKEFFTQDEYERALRIRTITYAILTSKTDEVNFKLEKLELIDSEPLKENNPVSYKINVSKYNKESSEKIDDYEFEVQVKPIEVDDKWQIDLFSPPKREYLR